jgi:hypothetical protein
MAASQMGESRFEISYTFRLSPRAFRVDDEDFSPVQGLGTPGKGVAIPPQQIAAFDGDDAEHIEGDPRKQAVAQEIIGRSSSAYPKQLTHGEQGHQDKGVNMIIVIGNDDCRPLPGQPFPMTHVHTQHNQYEGPHTQQMKQQSETINHHITQ